MERISYMKARCVAVADPVESKAFKAGRRTWRSVLSIANARRSLSGKLMVVMLMTTAIALASAGAALLYTDLRDNRAT